jgi:hypothetical protein
METNAATPAADATRRSPDQTVNESARSTKSADAESSQKSLLPLANGRYLWCDISRIHR